MRTHFSIALLVLALAAGTATAQPPRLRLVTAAPTIQLAPIPPAGLRFLEHSAVRTELALTAKQKETADRLLALWNVPPRDWEGGSLGWVPAAAAEAMIRQRTDDFLSTDLTRDQQTRLNQVMYQLKEREFGAHAAFAMAAKDLGLRADQAEDVDNIKWARVEDILKAVTSGERFEKVKTKVDAANTDTFEKMAEMLTRAQRERLREMKGKAFEANVDFTSLVPNRSSHKYPPTLFGVYDLELRYLKDPTVRAELKITNEQVKNLDQALAEWQAEFVGMLGSDEGVIARLHFHTERSLEKYLDAEQRTRLDQIMLQRRARAGPEAMCGHPAAVAALKLSPLQLQQLKGGKPLGDVLTANQAAARERLLGKPFDLPGGVADPYLAPSGSLLSTWPRYAFARYFLVLSERLKLSPDQVKKLRELAEDEPKIKELIQKELGYPDVQNVVGAGRGAFTADAVREKYQATVEEQCWKVLDEQQQSLARQMFGRRK